MAVPKIIVALDRMNEQAALAFAEKTAGRAWGFKVNDLFFRRGAGVLQKLRRFGGVFCDGKFHDIPNTVANTVAMLAETGAADLVTVHASGGEAMIRAAVKAAGEKMKIIAVTVLTSLDDAASGHVFGADAGEAASRLAAIAATAGAHGIVCSPRELASIRAAHPALETVVPGIRPEWYGVSDDQARAATPAAAARDGATYIVIGRPVTQADDPNRALEKIAREMEER